MNIARHIVRGMLATRKPSHYWVTYGVSYEFAELFLSKSLQQKNNQSVWEHTMSVLDKLNTKNDTTLLAALFHDLGKTKCLNASARSKFDGHEEHSYKTAKRQLLEWNATSAVTGRVLRIVRTHMLDISNMRKEQSVRKFVARIGIDNVDNWFALRMADAASYPKYGEYHKDFIAPFRTSVTNFLSSLPCRERPKFKPSLISENIKIRGVE